MNTASLYCRDDISIFNETSKKQEHLFYAFLQNKLKDLKMNERFILDGAAFCSNYLSRWFNLKCDLHLPKRLVLFASMKAL